MNRLKKKAWEELISNGICLLITISGTLFMASANVQGLGYLLIWVIVGVPTGIIFYLWETKKLRQFDEREKEMIQRALSASVNIFFIYLLTFSLAAFFLIGGGGSVPVVFMPLMFFSGLFVYKCSESFILLIQCVKEEDE